MSWCQERRGKLRFFLIDLSDLSQGGKSITNIFKVFADIVTRYAFLVTFTKHSKKQPSRTSLSVL